MTTVLGYCFALPLPRLLGIPQIWGAAGLTASAGIAGWVELLLLRRTMNARIGTTGLPASYVAKLWTAAIAAAAAAWAVKLSLPPSAPMVAAVLILGPYGVVFLTATMALRLPDARSFIRRAALGNLCTGRFRASSASRPERKARRPTAYLNDTPRASRRRRSGVDRAS